MTKSRVITESRRKICEREERETQLGVFMARPTSPAASASGAYVVVFSNGKLAVPVEALPLLADMLLLEQSFKDGRANYSIISDEVRLTMIPEAEVTAMRTAAKKRKK